MANITTYPNQFYHNSGEPLDSTAQVNTVAELNDNSKLKPYVGKMVFVKENSRIYICSKAVLNTEVTPKVIVGTWRPFFNANGMEFYLTSPDGTKLYTVSADNEGRLDVVCETIVESSPAASAPRKKPIAKPTAKPRASK